VTKVFSDAFAKLQNAIISFMSVRPSVCLHETTRFALDRVLLNLVFENFSETEPRNFNFCYYLIRITGIVHEDLYKFVITSRLILLRMRNISDFVFDNFFPENLALYELIWKNVVEPDNPRITIQRSAENMRCACRITKARKQTLLILNTYCSIID
jgi:hypothetical protein